MASVTIMLGAPAHRRADGGALVVAGLQGDLGGRAGEVAHGGLGLVGAPL